MRKWYKCMAVGLLVLLCSGCTKLAGMDASTVKEIAEAAIDSKDFQGFVNSVFDLKYSVCTDAQKGLVDACVSKSSILETFYDKENSVYVVRVSVPDPTSLLAAVEENREQIGTDLDKLRLKGASEEDLKECMLQNATNLVLTGACENMEKDIAVSFDAKTGRAADDSDLCALLFAPAEQAYPVDYGSTQKEETGVPEPSGSVTQDGAFTCHYNGCPILVSDVVVQTGEEALAQVWSLGSINATMQTEPGCEGYYVTYHVTNLSRADIVFSNAFVAVSNGSLVANTGFAPAGLHDVESIAPSETKEVSCYIVCSGDASLKWYSAFCDVYLDLVLE